MIEFRIGWAASSNASFRGTSDWEAFEDDPDITTTEGVEDFLNAGHGHIPYGMQWALDHSGFEWWVETREADG